MQKYEKDLELVDQRILPAGRGSVEKTRIFCLCCSKKSDSKSV